IGLREALALDEMENKALGKVLRVVIVVAGCAHKDIDWAPVDCTDSIEHIPGFLRMRRLPEREEQRPWGGGEGAASSSVPGRNHTATRVLSGRAALRQGLLNEVNFNNANARGITLSAHLRGVLTSGYRRNQRGFQIV